MYEQVKPIYMNQYPAINNSSSKDNSPNKTKNNNNNGDGNMTSLEDMLQLDVAEEDEMYNMI